MRHICYVSGTRADFGLLARALTQLNARPGVRLTVVVTGMHLSARYGSTAREIRRQGLRILAEVPSPLHPASGATMARAVAAQLRGFAQAWTRSRPDLVVVLGDRGEMLAGATAAVLLGIPVAHVHGGERSGTVDESFRHAISKLAHYHLVATRESQRRLRRMGEARRCIFVTGAPGIDELHHAARPSRAQLWREAGLDSRRKTALVVLHPVVQEQTAAARQTLLLHRGLQAEGFQMLWLLPNADAGSDGIRSALAGLPAAGLKLVTHLPRASYLAWMARADLLAGNSSSAIIEAATFGTPVVNVGARQNGRERNRNVIDAPWSLPSIRQAVRLAARRPRRPGRNIYGDGRASPRICRLLATLPLTPDLLFKLNAY